MPRRTPVLTALLAALALSPAARAELTGPEADILRRVEQRYASLDRYLLEGSIRVEMRGAREQSQEASFLSASDGRGRMRDEVTNMSEGGMIVSDGTRTVIYSGALGQYVSRPGDADSVLSGRANRGIGNALVTRLARLSEGALSARRLPDETLTLGTGPRDCIVLEVEYAPGPQPQIQEMPRIYWIDKESHLVLRQRNLSKADLPQFGGKLEQEETILFRRAQADPALPDSLWAFRPPPGSREVDEFESDLSLKDRFAGKPALDFTLKDLDGRNHSLKALRGKTVLLDFWATWCGPCRITMPQVAKIHAEYKGRGVEVMSINVGESASRAGAYMKKNGYTFPTLLDEDRAVSNRYRVEGIPTLIVIDREGTVTDYMVGARDEASLRAALKKAGVE